MLESLGMSSESLENSMKIEGSKRSRISRIWPFRKERIEEKPPLEKLPEERLPVRQEDPMGCAVACVAYILGKNYEEALAFFLFGHDDAKKSARSRGFEVNEIASALNRGSGWRKPWYSFNYILDREIDEKTYPPESIVFLRESEQYLYGHYLVRTDNNKWMDPWINFPEKEIEAGFIDKLPDTPSFLVARNSFQVFMHGLERFYADLELDSMRIRNRR